METISNFPVDPPADLDAADVAKLGLNLPPSPAADVGSAGGLSTCTSSGGAAQEFTSLYEVR